MFKVSHTTLVYISGLIWLAVGFMLLRLGLTLLVGSATDSTGFFPLTTFLSTYMGLNSAVLLLVGCAFFIGYMKGRFVLGKSAHRGVERILSFSNPTNLGNIYSLKYYILLGGMIALGVSIKYLGIPNDIRGLVDVAIGVALLTGASIYFRHAVALKKRAGTG